MVSLGGYAEIFYRNVLASGVIPQLSLIAGPCAGGAVYSPAMTDFILMVKGSSQMFITGPDVIKTVTNEDVGFEDLGGALTHNARSGVAHFAADSEDEAFEQRARCSRSCRPTTWRTRPTSRPRTTPSAWTRRSRRSSPTAQEALRHARSSTRWWTTASSSRSSHCGRAISWLASRGWMASRSASVANQPAHLAGVLDIDSSVKAARFVRFCDAFNIPLVTLSMCRGFCRARSRSTAGSFATAKLLYAYCEATVPKLTVITRKAYGGAYDVMSSKHIRADFNFAWPTAEIAVMGVDAAVKIISQGTERGSRPGRAQAELAEDTRTLRQPVCRGRARLHRRSDRAKGDPPGADPRAAPGAQQTPEPAGAEAREHPRWLTGDG